MKSKEIRLIIFASNTWILSKKLLMEKRACFSFKMNKNTNMNENRRKKLKLKINELIGVRTVKRQKTGPFP